MLKSVFSQDELKTIVEGCLREDPVFQRKLYDLLSGTVMAVAVRYSVFQADDIFQEAMIKIFRSLHRVSNFDTFFGWVRKLTVNEAIDQIKRAQRLHFDSSQQPPQSIAANDQDVFGHLSNEELLEMIASLPEGYRLIFNLYEIEGYAHKEISKMLSISEGTSKSQLHKAKLALKAMLKKNLPMISIYTSVFLQILL